MIGLSRIRTFFVCAAVLALSAGWNFGARPELAAQSAAADGTLDPALVSAFKWRSVGPDRGGRSIAVSGVKGRAEGGVLRRDRRRPLEDDRRRREVGAGHRRPDHELVGRRRRRLRIEPRHRLHRHGRGVHPRQHHGAATASTSRPTPARPGRTSASTTPTRSRRSASTRPTPTSSSSPTSAATARTTTSAASSRAPTAARPGRRCCSATPRPARSTSRSIARTRA